MKKITKATFKSFIKKNEGNLFIQTKSYFDGSIDGTEFIKKEDRKFIVLNKKTLSEIDYVMASSRGTSREELENCVFNSINTLGYEGIWLVTDGDGFSHYEDENFVGISVYNCCRSFIIAIPKEKKAV